MQDLFSPKEYANTMTIIGSLKNKLYQLVEQKGTGAAEVIALSQTIDHYIVQVQTCWNAYHAQAGDSPCWDADGG